jgi:hypothetical protein
MDCGWDDAVASRKAALAAFESDVGKQLAAADIALPSAESDGRILYPALLAALGLRVRDVDIRFSHPNEHYAPFDRGYKARTVAKTVMDLGYIEYRGNDNNKVNGATHYFNSYFDGSASFDELLVAHILADIASAEPDYAKLYELNSLTAKYQHVVSRFELDKELFAKMDSFGKWFPLPYPRHLQPLHHRQTFMRRRGGKLPFRDQHRAVCSRLRTDLADPASR